MRIPTRELANAVEVEIEHRFVKHDECIFSPTTLRDDLEKIGIKDDPAIKNAYVMGIKKYFREVKEMHSGVILEDDLKYVSEKTGFNIDEIKQVIADDEE